MVQNDMRSAGARLLVSFAAVLVAASAAAAAQPPPPPPPPLPHVTPAPSQNDNPTPSPDQGVDQRIRALQDQLGITAAQMPEWNAFAQAMRDSAVSTDKLFRQRASEAASMNALDNMKSYARVVRAYADNTDRLEAAFEILYNSLSDQQRQTLDTLFRRDAAQSTAPLPSLR
jgi:periplasmic protein CpxP/Spy